MRRRAAVSALSALAAVLLAVPGQFGAAPRGTARAGQCGRDSGGSALAVNPPP